MTSYRVIFDEPTTLAPIEISYVDEPHSNDALEMIAGHLTAMLRPRDTVQVRINAVDLTGHAGVGVLRDACAFRLAPFLDGAPRTCRECGCGDVDAFPGAATAWMSRPPDEDPICCFCFAQEALR